MTLASRLRGDNPQESRKELFLHQFNYYGKKSKYNENQFWKHDSHPFYLYSNELIQQKVNYIHNNPVEAGFVTDPIEWKYSSARNYGNNDHTILEIDLN